MDIRVLDTNNNTFIRYRDNNNEFIYKKGQVDYMEGYYNFTNFV
jgi:hypothetical protein